MQRLLLLLAIGLSVSAQSTITTWTLSEPAGINHPAQRVCFPYSGGLLRYEANRVLGPSSTEVAWQQRRDGAVCVIASLTANDTGDVYTLQSGAPTTAVAVDKVSMSSESSYVQITNGLVGIRVPTLSAQAAASPTYSLSPIQQVFLGGSWVGGTTTIQKGMISSSGSLNYCTAYNLTIKDSGPIFSTISTALRCNRPAYVYGATTFREAGEGFYNAEMTVVAGQKSVLFGFYTDLEVFWKLDITSAYSPLPNLLGWRGISSASVSCGYYLPDGVTKTLFTRSVEMSALRDLSYASTLVPYYFGSCTSRTPSMVANYGSGAGADNAFVQWLLNDTQGESYPVTGMWTSGGSKQNGRLSNAGFETYNSGISIYVGSVLRGPDNSFEAVIGAEYGFFFGTQLDVPDKTEHLVRPAALLNAMNTMRGPLSLENLYANTLAVSDPAGGYKWPFLPEATMAAQIVRINTNTAYYNALAASGTGTEGTRFVDWARYQDATRRNAILSAGTEIKTAIGRWVLGDGRFDATYHYYQGLYPFIRNIDNFHAVIKDPGASAAQIAEAKQWLGLGTFLANSNDFFNFDELPDGGGNQNQVYQHNVYRNLLRLSMSHHPSISSDNLRSAIRSLSTLLDDYWNSVGAGKASTHYQSNYAEPSVGLMLAAIKKGVISSPDAYTNLLASIHWDISSLTPIEPRFNNKRKSYSNGDGNTEAATRLGLLGTAFNSTDAALSNKAIWAWRSQDTASRYTHGSFYFPTVGLIDDQISQTDPSIGSLYMSGYHAALRTRWESVNETAAWFITGGWYNDHKHRDNGQVSIYAHNAPLSIDWNANLYSPQTAGGYMHSRAVKESQLSVAWDGIMTSYGSPDIEWGTAAATEFGKFNYGSFSRSTFGGTWTRDVRLLSHSAPYPVIIIKDSFTGADADVPKIVSSMHMATGAVSVNGSNVTPTTRNYDSGQFPSCTAGASLLPGINRLQFTGQLWTQHATSGIDWDAYVNVSAAASYCLGNWSHISHASREMSEYQSANGSSFRERQHILRVKTSDAALETILLPWRKGESATFTVTNEACGTQIVRGTHTLCSSADKVQWTDGTDYSLMATGTASASYQGMTISGGPGEIRTSSGSCLAIVDGLTAATRTITLPAGSWYPNAAAVSVSGNQFRLFHDGTTGSPRQVSFSSTESGGVMSLGFAPTSGAAEVRISLDGVAIAQEPCATRCSLSIRVPSGTYTMQHRWIDGAGAVISTSSGKSITI